MKRVISAAVGIPLVVLAVFLSPPPLYRGLAAVLAALALTEYLRLCGIAGPLGWAATAGGAAAAAAAGTAEGGLLAGGALLLLLALSTLKVGDPARRFRETGEAVLGMVYIAYAFAVIVLLRQLPHGAAWTMVFLAVIWAGDTAAYYGGTMTGRRRLAPLLSPNKTWEGAAWGLAGSAVAGGILTVLLVREAALTDGLFVGFAVGISGQVGDLVQSLWKRAKGVKDSGHLIPGHGGLLDRIDSLLLGIPVGYNLLNHWMY